MLYLIFRTQFHPEKNAYEFSPVKHYDHSEENIEFARYLSDKFVKESKYNKNKADINFYLEYSNPQLIHIPGLSFTRVYLWE